MSSIPRASGFAQALSFALTPNKYIGTMCDRLRSDFFEAPLVLGRTVCLRGEEAATLFYDERLFEQAAPGWLESTLVRLGSLRGLDEAKPTEQMLLHALLSKRSLARARRLLAEEWWLSFAWWRIQDSIVLYDELQTVLTRVACAWTGVPLPEVDVSRRAKDIVLLFDAVGAWQHVEAHLAQRRLDAWLGWAIRDARTEGSSEPESALARLARSSLEVEDAAQQLRSIIASIVGLSVYVVLAAAVLHEHPGRVPRDEDERRALIEDVRKAYPSRPPITARVRQSFRWRGVIFHAGRRVLLDSNGTSHPRRSGEELDLVLLDEALRQLTECMTYRVQLQAFDADDPGLPHGHMVLENVRARAVTEPLHRRLGEESRVVPRARKQA